MSGMVKTEDVIYARRGARELKARIYRPDTPSPWPAVIDIHGGAWSGGDLTDGAVRDEALAHAGILAVAIEFRDGVDGYPASLQDINEAIRWLKASSLGIRPDRVGLTGNSSGGHLAMLAAMRPRDARYAELGGYPGVDASVRCVGMLWPVINPLSRYHHARRHRDRPTPAAWVGNIPERQEGYWKSEAAMAEGNPVLILERKEPVSTPPALWVLGRPDDHPHDYRDPDSAFDGNEPERFVHLYRAAGGSIELVSVDQARRSEESIAPLVAFFRKHLR
jgi:acetyl esterase/lipase